MNLETRIKKIPFIRYYSGIILVILLAVTLTFGLFRLISYFNKEDNDDFIITESGNDIKIIELADKTIIYLNRNSKLIYRNSFYKSDRELILEGEAYFEVEYADGLPFMVFTDKSLVLVKGTQFYIREDTGKVFVTVVSGVVTLYEADNKKNRIELGPNQSGSYDKKTNEISYRKINDHNFISWQDRELMLEQIPVIKNFDLAAASKMLK